MPRPTAKRPTVLLRLIVLVALTIPETAKVGAQLLASGSVDETIKLWSAKGDGSDALIQTLSGHSSYVRAVAFSPDGKLLASGSYDWTIKLWSAKGDGTAALIQTLSGHSNWVHAVAFSPDGKLLASGSSDNTIKLWSAKGDGSDALIQTLSGHSSAVRAVAFSPDGKVLASGSDDNTIKLWSAKGDGSDALIQTLSGHSDYVRAVAFSPDGKVLASGSRDNTIKLWSAKGDGSDALIQTLSGHSDHVYAVAFSPDGKVLASGSDDDTIKLWSAKGDGSDALIQTLSGHSNDVMAVAFSPDGKVLASASIDRTIKLWSAKGDGSDALIQTLSGHSDHVACEPCSRGRYQTSDDGKASCEACVAGKYGDQTAQKQQVEACIDCSAGKYSVAAGASEFTQCTECPIGKFGEQPGATKSDTCKSCPASKYGIAPGKPSETTGCQVCDTPGYQDETEAENYYCAAGQRGPLCALCEPGFSRWSNKVMCTPCPEELGTGIAMSILSIIGMLVLLALCLIFNRKAPNGILRPLINAAQMMMVVLMFPVDWPESIMVMTHILEGINFSFVKLASPSCIGVPINFYWRLIIMMAVTAAIIGLPWLVSWLRHRKNAEKWDGAVKARLRDTFLIVVLLHPTLSGMAFYHFRCQTVANTSYLMADYSLVCGDETWHWMLIPVLFVTVFFALGMPLLFAFVLWRRRHKLLDDPKTKRLYGMLYSAYKPDLYYYESVIMFFKLGLWATLVFFKNGSQFQLATSALLCVLQLCAHARFEPYEDYAKNVLQYLGLFLIAFTSFSGLVLNYLKTSRELAIERGDKQDQAYLESCIAGFNFVAEFTLWLGVVLVVCFSMFLSTIVVVFTRTVMRKTHPVPSAAV
eukprot:g2385.t1